MTRYNEIQKKVEKYEMIYWMEGKQKSRKVDVLNERMNEWQWNGME